MKEKLAAGALTLAVHVAFLAALASQLGWHLK